MDQELLSIIIPVYKSEQTLERCIHSLTGQTYQSLEIIMIVDGPPDTSGVLADKLASEDSRIKVIHQDNMGVSCARNTGVKAAAGLYLQFVDSDDFLEPDACESMVCAMDENNSDMVIAGFYHLYFGKKVKKIPDNPGTYIIRESKAEFLCVYEGQFLNMPWNKLFKKKFITKEFQKNMNLGEDLLFNVHYMKNIESFTVLDRAVYDYVQDDRGTTLSTKARDDRIQVAITLLHQMQKICEPLYGSKYTGGVLENKVLVEFLDEVEGTAFLKYVSPKERRIIIKEYRDAWLQVLRESDEPIPIRLKLADYKMIYPFFIKGNIGMVQCLVIIRGWIVILFRKGKIK